MLAPLTCTHAVHGEVFQLVELNDLADGCTLFLFVLSALLMVPTDAIHEFLPFGIIA